MIAKRVVTKISRRVYHFMVFMEKFKNVNALLTSLLPLQIKMILESIGAERERDNNRNETTNNKINTITR